MHRRREVRGFSFGHWFATPSGDAVKPHAHADAHFMFVVAGRYVTRTGSTLIYNPADTVHRDRFVSAGSFFALTISAELCERLPTSPTGIHSVASHAIVRHLMRECATWDRDSDLIAESLCFELLGFPGRTESRAPRWLEHARTLLHEQSVPGISIRNLAKFAGVHEVHLARTFRKFYRCTPGEYLRNLRVEAAASLLSTTTRDLSDIALDTGFADQSHLTRIFRRAVGVTPGEYRGVASCLSRGGAEIAESPRPRVSA